MSTSRVEPWLVARRPSRLKLPVWGKLEYTTVRVKLQIMSFSFFTKESRGVMKGVLIKFPTECNYVSVSLLTQRTSHCGG